MLPGTYVVTQGGSASISFLVPSGGGAVINTTNVVSSISPPDVGPALLTTGGHTVSGTIVWLNSYVAGQGGVLNPDGPLAGASVRGPVKQPIVTLSDLGGNDQMVQVARWGDNGQFAIPHVPTAPTS